jgi:hypothetical protein
MRFSLACSQAPCASCKMWRRSPPASEVDIFDTGLREAQLCCGQAVGQTPIGAHGNFAIQHHSEPFVAAERSVLSCSANCREGVAIPASPSGLYSAVWRPNGPTPGTDPARNALCDASKDRFAVSHDKLSSWHSYAVVRLVLLVTGGHGGWPAATALSCSWHGTLIIASWAVFGSARPWTISTSTSTSHFAGATIDCGNQRRGVYCLLSNSA